MKEPGAKKRLCMITCPVEDYEKDILKYAIKLRADKTILVDENESCKELLNRCGLITDVVPIFKDSVNLVTDSTLKLISKAKNEHDEVCVVLLPSDPITTIGMYVAACMEKVEVHTTTPDFETEYLTLPHFLSANNINKSEMFILTKIIENKEISKKRLLKIIEKEEKSDFLGSRTHSKEESVLKYIQKILNKLEKKGFVNKRREGKHFIWNPTLFSKLIFDHKKNVLSKDIGSNLSINY